MLTDAACRSAEAGPKAYKLTDSKGLHLFVSTTGFRSWRWKYRFGGVEKRMTFGEYPEVSLKQARDLRDDGRQKLRQGIDPRAEKKRAARRAAGVDSFRPLALRWHENQKRLWSPKHAKEVLDSLEEEVFDATPRKANSDLWSGKFGDLPIDEISAPQVLEVVEQVQARGAVETAHRVLGRISAVFGLAIGAGLVKADPAAAIAKALQPVRKGRRPALRKLDAARELVRAIEEAPSQPQTQLASRLLALTAVRPGMIRFADPREFEGLDTAEPLWRIPPEKMKLLQAEKEDDAFEFLVPLAAQAVDVVRISLRRISRDAPYLFPSIENARRPMSENALSYLYRRVPQARGRHVPHGWRSTFSTIMNERAIELERPGDRAIIDLMLAHKPEGVEAIYNRAAYMGRRRQLAQEWADLLLEGLPPASSLLEGPRR